MKKRIIIVFSCLLILTLVGGIYLNITNNEKLNNGKSKSYVLKKIGNNPGNIKITQGWMRKYDNKYFISGYYNSSQPSHYAIVYDNKGNNITPREAEGNLRGSTLLSDEVYAGFSLEKADALLSGFINNKGKFILDYKYEEIRAINKKYLIVKANDKYGVYDISGKLVLPLEYDFISSGEIKNNTDNLFVVVKNGKRGVIDSNKKIVIPLEYDSELTNYAKMTYYKTTQEYNVNNKNYYVLRKNNKYGLINQNNKVIIDFNYDRINYAKNINMIYYLKDNSLIFYDLKSGKTKELKINDNMLKNGELNFADLDGRGLQMNGDIVIEDSKNPGTLYIINKSLEMMTINNVQYKEGMYRGYYLFDNYYIKKKNDKYEAYKLNNDLLFKDKFSYIENITTSDVIPSSYILLCLDNDKNSCGLVDYKGKKILDFEYKLEKFNSFGVIFSKDNKYLLVDSRNYNNQFTLGFDKKLENEIDAMWIYGSTVAIRYNNNNGVLYNKNFDALNKDSFYNQKKVGDKIILTYYKRTDNYEGECVYEIYDLAGNKIDVKTNDSVLVDSYDDEEVYLFNDNGFYLLESK